MSEERVTLTLRDRDRVLSVATRLVSCSTTEAFCEIAVRETAALMPCVSCAWNEVNLRSGHTRGCSTMDVDPAVIAREMAPWVQDHPVIASFMKTRDGQAHAISDFLSRRHFRSMELYRNFYRRYRTEDQLSVAALFDEQWLLGIVINRDTWGFTEREKAMLNALRPFYFRVYARLSRLAEFSMLDKGVPLQAGSRKALSERLRKRGLTPREADTAALLAEGQTNAELAAALGICTGTVRKHVDNVFRKLGARNRAEATRKVLGLLAPKPRD